MCLCEDVLWQQQTRARQPAQYSGERQLRPPCAREYGHLTIGRAREAGVYNAKKRENTGKERKTLSRNKYVCVYSAVDRSLSGSLGERQLQSPDTRE